MITFYAMVDDLRASLDKAVSLGATEVLAPMEMDVNDSKFSIAGFIDPEGNYIGLYKPLRTKTGIGSGFGEANKIRASGMVVR